MIQGVRQFGYSDGRASGYRLVGSNIELAIPLLQYFHPVQEMFELGPLGQKCRLCGGKDGKSRNYQQPSDGFYNLRHRIGMPGMAQLFFYA